MAKVKEIAMALAATLLLDQYNKTSHITPLIEGVHGIGKSTAASVAADMLNKGYYASIKLDGENVTLASNFKESFDATVDATVLKEGEITGWPHLVTDPVTGEEKLSFALYEILATIKALQKSYYEKASTEGFILPNDRKLFVSEDGTEYILNPDNSKVITRPMNKIIKTKLGYHNIYQLGEYLDPEDRIHLIRSGQINGFVFLLDELNRAERAIFSELMNMALNRRMNGYLIPWWVLIVAAQNPASKSDEYSTNELDKAQLDRFCYMRMDADITEWANWAMDAELPEEWVQTIALLGNKSFSPAQEDAQFDIRITPSPRSQYLAGNVFKNYGKVAEMLKDEFVGDDGRTLSGTIYRLIGTGLIGADTWDTMHTTLKNSQNLVTIEQILTGDSKDIHKEIKEKIENQSPLAKHVLANSLLRWICNNWLTIEFKSMHGYDSNGKPSLSVKASDADKKIYECYKSQMKQLFDMLPQDVQFEFTYRVVKSPMDCIDENGQRIKKVLLMNLKEICVTIAQDYYQTKQVYN